MNKAAHQPSAPSATPAQLARAHVVELLRLVGPEAPTLCEGWQAQDLAAHLVVREHRPDAMPGILIPALTGHTAKVQENQRARGYARNVELVAGGAPRYNLMSLNAVDAKANLREYAIHAEDIRRAQPDDVAAGLPQMPAEVLRALGRGSALTAKLALRRSPIRVLVKDELGTVLAQAGPRTARASDVVASGSALELMLFFSGRQDAADVQITGNEADQKLLQEMQMGI